MTKTLITIALITLSTIAAAQTYQQPYYRQQQSINQPIGTTMGPQPQQGDSYYQGAAPRINQLSPGGGQAVDGQQYYIQPNGNMGTQNPMYTTPKAIW